MDRVIERHSANLLLPVLLGCAHGMADAAAGFLLGVLPHHLPPHQTMLLIVLYNVLAFGYQPLAGWLSDRFQCYRLAVYTGLLSLAASLLLVPHSLLLAIGLAGLGSAIFHVGGGALAYRATSHPTIASGLFTAPGVLGLAIGGISGFTTPTSPLLPLLLLGLLILPPTLALSPHLPHLPHLSHLPQHPTPNSQHLPPLLSAIALISTLWTGMQMLLMGQLHWLLGVAIAAALGKLIGGYAAERWGRRRWAIGALLAAIPLLLGSAQFLWLLPGVALLQSSVPITLVTTIQQMPHRPATATGLALGLAILIGGIPVLTGISLFTHPVVAVGVILAIAVILLTQVPKL